MQSNDMTKAAHKFIRIHHYRQI